MPRQPTKRKPLRCPYCGKEAQFRRSSEHVYRHNRGPIWECPDCDARVGCERGTYKPLGTLANKADRDLRKRAHVVFDAVWQAKVALGHSEKLCREVGYAWLAKQLGKPRNQTHIAMMNGADLRMVIPICTPYFENLRNRKPLPSNDELKDDCP